MEVVIRFTSLCYTMSVKPYFRICTCSNCACHAILVMFIITDLIRNEKKDAALNHIRFWLRSIKTHAVSERSDGDSADLSFRQAPVVLISTQLRKAWTMMASQIL
jgi:hypothetical protein